MRIFLLTCTSSVLFSFSAMGLSAPSIAESALRCEGKNESQQLIQISMYASDSLGTAAVVTMGDRRVPLNNLRSQVSHHTKTPTSLKWLSPQQIETFSLQRNNDDNYTLTYRVPIVPIGSLRTRVMTGVLTNANCVVTGDWEKKLVEVIPQDFSNMKSLLDRQASDNVIASAITLVHTSDYTDEEKASFYQEVLGRKNPSLEVLRPLIEAIFSENTKSELQTSALALLTGNDIDLTAAAANALARCQACVSLHEKTWIRLYALVRTQLQQRIEGALESWRAFANLAFRDKAQNMPFLPEALDLIFKTGSGTNDLVELLTSEIPSNELSKGAEGFIDRLVASPNITSRQLVMGLKTNHANASRGMASLPILLQRQALQKVMLKKAAADVETTKQMHWLLAEEFAEKMAPSEVAPWVVARPNDFAVVGNALAWMAEQKDPVPSGRLIIEHITRNIRNVNPTHIDFMFEGSERGVLHDLAIFSFSEQARKLDVGFTTLVTLLSARLGLSSQLLQKIGMMAYESKMISDAEAEQILALVIQHPNYVEGTTSALPGGGMISVYLARALKLEKKKDAPPTRFDVPLLGLLLKQIVETRRLDRDDPSIEKTAQALLKQVMTL